MKLHIRQRYSPALLAVVALLASCSDGVRHSGAEDKPALVLGFGQVRAVGGWDTANAASVRKAALDAGVDLRMADAHTSLETQVAQLRSFVSQHVDVIAFSPVVETGWEVVLREIRSANIPVILVDRNIKVSDDSLYASHIGSDFVEEGRRAGRWLLELTRGEAGEIGIAELQGTVDSAPANDRSQGFFEVLVSDPRYHLIRSESANFDRTLARELMTEFLKANGHRIRVLFAHSDVIALGAIEAIEAAGLKPGSDILVISVEGSRKGLEAIIAGKLNVTVECNPQLGPQLLALVKDVAAGKLVPKRVTTRESVFSRENAAQELPNRPY